MKIKKIPWLLVICFIFAAAPGFAQNDKSEESFFMAKKAYEDGFYEVSIGLLERYFSSNADYPKNPQARLLLAQCHFNSGRFFEALKILEGLLNDTRAYTLKDAVYYWIAEVHFKSNNFQQAIDFYERLVAEFPSSAYAPSAYYSLGWAFYQMNNYAKALDNFRALENKFPKEPQAKEAAFKIIECFYNLKDYEGLKKAIKPYFKIYAGDRLRQAYLYFYQAEADYYLNNWELAAQNYAKAYSAATEDKVKALARLGLGWSYLKLKKYKDSENAFSDINHAALDKKSKEVLLLAQAILMSEDNRVNEAKKIYDEILNTSSDPMVLIQAYIGKGDALSNLAEYAEAIKVYKKGAWLIDANANFPSEITSRLRYNLSLAYAKQGQFTEAINELQDIAKNSAGQSEKLKALCQIADVYQAKGDYLRAREFYKQILKDYPGSSYSDYLEYQTAVMSLKISDYPAAITILADFRKKYPASEFSGGALYALGLAYFQNRDYSGVLKLFGDSQAGFKDNALKQQFNYLSASSLFNLSRFNEAVIQFKNIINSGFKDNELAEKAEYGIADCYYRMGNEQEALTRFELLRSKFPGSVLAPEIMLWLGSYYYRNGELVVARRYLSSLIKDFPKSDLLSDAYYLLGSTYLEEGRIVEARENFDKVINSGDAERFVPGMLAIADSYARQGKFSQAVDTYQDLAGKCPNLVNLIYPKLAGVFYLNNDYQQARDYYRKCLKTILDKDAADIWFKIAECSEGLGDFNQAPEEYLKAAEAYPLNSEFFARALLRAAKIYEDQDNLKQALIIYERILRADTPEAGFAKERIDEIKAGLMR